MVLTASIFLVVAIAYERYIAVCNPYDYRAIVNTQSTRRRVTKLLTPVVIATILINIPKYFETYTVEVLQSLVSPFIELRSLGIEFFKIKAKVHLTAAFVKLLRLDKNLRGFRILYKIDSKCCLLRTFQVNSLKENQIIFAATRIHARQQRDHLQLQRDQSTSGFILYHHLRQLVSIDHYGSASHGSTGFSQWVRTFLMQLK